MDPDASRSQTSLPNDRSRPATPARRNRRLVAMVAVAAVLAVAAVWQYAGRLEGPRPAPPAQDWLDVADPLPDGSAPAPDPEVAALKHEATQAVRRLLEEFPETAEALDVAALLHLRFGRVDQAERCWNRCLELNPQSASAHFALGSLARNKGDFPKAAEHFRRATEIDAESPQVFHELADVFLKQGDLDRAQAAVEQGLERDPRFFPGLYQLGQIHLQRGDYAKARKALEAAVPLGSDFAGVYFALVTACTKLGDAEQAAVYAEKFRKARAGEEASHRDSLRAPRDSASDLRHGVAEVYTAASRVYLLYGQAQAAERLLVRASELGPTWAECGDMLARLYEQQGRLDEALATLSRFSLSAPRSIAIQVHLGRLAAEAGRFELAEQACQKAIELSPGEARAYAMLADLYLRSDRKLAEARRLAEKAVELAPEAPLYRLLSVACQKTGDVAGARAASQKASAVAPGSGQ